MSRKASLNVGYQGFVPAWNRIPEVAKPGDSREAVDSKFANAGRSVAYGSEPPLEFNPYASMQATALFGATKPSDYRPPNRRGVMAKHDARAPVRKPFIAQSEYRSNFASFIEHALQVRDCPEERWREAFDRADRDGSSCISRSEVAEVISAALGRPAGADEVCAFMAHFDKNGDAKISWEEFHAGLAAIREHMRRQVPTHVSKHSEPSWMKSSAPTVVKRPPGQSSYQRDLGTYGTRPAARPLVDGSGMASTTRDLDEGTSKCSMALPGYSGFVPAAPYNPDAVKQAHQDQPRDSLRKVPILETYARDLPGYTGYVPRTAANRTGAVRPTELTTTGAAMLQAQRVWEARRSAAQ